jgi:hypothetical protein
VIISDVRAKPARAALTVPLSLGIVGLIVGSWTAHHHRTAGLTLAHYDAKAHLVVARRIVDSLTPGYQQIGAVWLPLPHLLNAPFVQYDPWFRSGASAVTISIAAFALAVFCAAGLVLRVTRTALASVAAATFIAINPNLLYLQSTPMTEPLLLATSFAAVWALFEWIDDQPDPRIERSRSRSTAAAVLLALASLTRYEAWPIVVTALLCAWFALWRQRLSAGDALRRLVRVASWPLAAIAGFLIHSRITVGEWFVRDFFTPDNPARGDATLTTAQVWWGLAHLSGPMTAGIMCAGALLLFVAAVFSRRQAPLLLLVAPLACVALPWLAFYDGHPYRIRYMIPVGAAGALAIAGAVGIAPRRWRTALTAAVVAIAVWEMKPLDARAPMVLEAQWDRPNSAARGPVIECLATRWTRGEKIMASMGSLAPFMQESASAGFALNDYLHEGNGDIWLQALISPRPYIEWILIQDYAEGGDMLARLAREHPAFLEGFTRQCEGGGVVLYRRE